MFKILKSWKCLLSGHGQQWVRGDSMFASRQGGKVEVYNRFQTFSFFHLIFNFSHLKCFSSLLSQRFQAWLLAGSAESEGCRGRLQVGWSSKRSLLWSCVEFSSNGLVYPLTFLFSFVTFHMTVWTLTATLGAVVFLANAELKVPQRQFFARCLLPALRPCLLPLYDHWTAATPKLKVESWNLVEMIGARTCCLITVFHLFAKRLWSSK